MNEILNESLTMLKEVVNDNYSISQKLAALREFIGTASDVLEKEAFSFEDKCVPTLLTNGVINVTTIFEVDGKLYVLGSKDKRLDPTELTYENVIGVKGLILAVIDLFEKQ